MDSCSVTQKMINFKAKNLYIENRSSSSQCDRFLHGSVSNIAFRLRPIWLQTLIVIDSESCQRLFPSFCAPPSVVAVLIDWNLSRRPFLYVRKHLCQKAMQKLPLTGRVSTSNFFLEQSASEYHHPNSSNQIPLCY